MRVNQPELLDGMRQFRFSNVGQVQTYHSNSVSALVALSEEVVATASYDRSIKIWGVSTGKLIRTLYDMNCVSCLAVLRLNNDKNPQHDTYSENDLLHLNASLLDNPHNNISSSGLLLLSGGFDKTVKVWDFTLQEHHSKPNSFSSLAHSSILSQGYQLETFPLKSLAGHTSWVTALASLEDQRNVVSGDDTGEVIVWDAVNGVLMYKLPYV